MLDIVFTLNGVTDVIEFGQNVNMATCHTDSLQDVDGRDKPGHDELRELS